MFENSPLEAAKDRLSIPAVGAMMFPDWKPGQSCRCPWRDDKKPSFSVYESGRRWKDFGNGEGGDVADFVAMACGLSAADGARKLIEMAGVMPHPNERTSLGNLVRSPDRDAAEKESKRASWPVFEKPSGAEIRAIAGLRNLGPEAVGILADRGLLWCADSAECRAWVVTDATRRNAQARRMDGVPWVRIGAKAWTLPGSEAGWPVGLREAFPFQAIALVEGSPDMLAAVHLSWCAGVEDEVAPVAMLGAANRIPDDALALFAGKRVRIFGHADDPGQAAAARWASQLAGVGCDVDGYSFGGLLQSSGPPVDDVCDFAHLDPDQWETLRHEVEEAFTFAPRCPTMALPGEGGVTVQAGACSALAGKEEA